MTYAALIDGLDPERREEFDQALLKDTDQGEKAKARRERAAGEQLARFIK